MKRITGYRWGASKGSLLTIYKTLIRSLIDYRCIAYDSANKTVKKKLDSIQLKALSIVTGALPGTALIALQNECGEMPLQLRRNLLTCKYAIKVALEFNHPTKQILEEHWTLHYGKYNKHQEPIAIKIQKYIIAQNWTNTTGKLSKPPPWQIYEKIKIDTELSNIKFIPEKQRVNLNTIATWMMKFKDYIQYFTDASKSHEDNQEIGIGYYSPSGDIRIHQRLTNSTTVDTGEKIAIKLAIEHIIDHYARSAEEEIDLNIVIFSDSLHSIKEIQNAYLKNVSRVTLDVIRLSTRFKRPITVAWVPSHYGIAGNEMADRLASLGRSENTINIKVIPDFKEIMNRVEEKIMIEWQKIYHDNSKATWYKKIEPKISTKLKFKCETRKKEITLTRIRLGRCLLNLTLHQMNNHPNGLYDQCTTSETLEHYLLECPRSGIGIFIEETTKNKEYTTKIGEFLRDELLII